MSAPQARSMALALFAAVAVVVPRPGPAFAGDAVGESGGGLLGLPGLPALREQLPDRVRIPAGTFVMGADDAGQAAALALCRTEPGAAACEPSEFVHEGPAHRVWLPAFSIDRHEVTVGDYARCQAALACVPPRVAPAANSGSGQNSARLPVTGITAQEAAVYCRFVGGRLPTEAEWERAAGGGPPMFPWGEQWNDDLAHHGGRRSRGIRAQLLGLPAVAPPPAGPVVVDAASAGESPYGVRHLAGNVAEWTADDYVPDFYASSPQVEPHAQVQPVGRPETLRVIRGGSYVSPPHGLRNTARRSLSAQAYAVDVGFRCAYDAAPSPATESSPERVETVEGNS